MTSPTQALFAPPVGSWLRLSPKYVAVRTVSLVTGTVLVTVPTAIWALVVMQLPWLAGVIAAVGVAWITWRRWRLPRWVASWGYAERDADLCISKGLWTKDLTIVPFGRLQVVRVTAGPLLRWQGLATVSLVTANALIDAQIPGLALEDAITLRDRMIELSDAKGSGL
jgi:uncharacterized protein